MYAYMYLTRQVMTWPVPSTAGIQPSLVPSGTANGNSSSDVHKLPITISTEEPKSRLGNGYGPKRLLHLSPAWVTLVFHPLDIQEVQSSLFLPQLTIAILLSTRNPTQLHSTRKMAFDDDDKLASEGLMDDVLVDDENIMKSSTKRRGRRTKFPTIGILYMLMSHILGWILALYLPSFLGERPKMGGDEVNGIVPPSEQTIMGVLSITTADRSFPVQTKLVRFTFETDDWVPGPNDPNVTDTIFDNWTRMLPSKLHYY